MQYLCWMLGKYVCTLYVTLESDYRIDNASKPNESKIGTQRLFIFSCSFCSRSFFFLSENNKTGINKTNWLTCFWIDYFVVVIALYFAWFFFSVETRRRCLWWYSVWRYNFFYVQPKKEIGALNRIGATDWMSKREKYIDMEKGFCWFGARSMLRVLKFTFFFAFYSVCLFVVSVFDRRTTKNQWGIKPMKKCQQNGNFPVKCDNENATTVKPQSQTHTNQLTQMRLWSCIKRNQHRKITTKCLNVYQTMLLSLFGYLDWWCACICGNKVWIGTIDVWIHTFFQ